MTALAFAFYTHVYIFQVFGFFTSGWFFFYFEGLSGTKHGAERNQSIQKPLNFKVINDCQWCKPSIPCFHSLIDFFIEDASVCPSTNVCDSLLTLVCTWRKQADVPDASERSPFLCGVLVFSDRRVRVGCLHTDWGGWGGSGGIHVYLFSPAPLLLPVIPGRSEWSLMNLHCWRVKAEAWGGFLTFCLYIFFFLNQPQHSTELNLFYCLLKYQFDWFCTYLHI